MLDKAKFLFQIMLWAPLIGGCVLLVSLFSPYRRNTLARKEMTGPTHLDDFGHPLASGMLGPEKY